MISDSTHREIVASLKEHIAFLEAELARSRSENRDLVNSLATQVRAPQPFRPGPVSFTEAKRIPIAGRKGIFQRVKELESQNRSKEV